MIVRVLLDLWYSGRSTTEQDDAEEQEDKKENHPISPRINIDATGQVISRHDRLG